MNEILQQRIEEAAEKYANSTTSNLLNVFETTGRFEGFEQGATFALRNQWISVEERLPEEEGRYLCNYHYKMSNSQDECDVVDFGLFKDGKWYTANDEVTHWTEILQLPKEEEK